MKRIFSVLGTAALAWSVVGCASDAPGANARGFNDLSMRLTLPDGLVIDVVHYAVSGGPGNVDRSGDVNVAQSSVLKFRVGDLRVGSGYTMQLSAVTALGTPCAGSAPFAIDDSDDTTLDMSMTCSGEATAEDDTSGDIRVNVDVDARAPHICPVATGISLLPAQGNVGSLLQIEGFTSSAPDAVSWSSTAGAFADSAAAATSFTCPSAGDITLSFAIQKTGCPASEMSAVASCGTPGSSLSEAMLALASNHACQVLPGDGRLVCWGNPISSVLGSGAATTIATSQPSANFVDSTLLPQGLETTWKLISTGFSRSCAITFAGDAYCWGANASGQLGRRSLLSSGVPVPVDISLLPPGTKWSWLSSGTSAAAVCGITSGGVGYCWGSNSNGQIGNPAAAASQMVPIEINVSALQPGTKWSVLSTGQTHSCGVTTAGAAYCWGNDAAGRLGNGPALTTQQNSPSPVDMTTLPPGTIWTTISAGNSHTCAVTTAGDLYCWGSDVNGKLGNGAAVTADQDHPVLVPRDGLQPGSGWARVSAGQNHSCGVTTDGAAFCWGGASPVLGNATATTAAPSPTAVDVSLLPPGTAWVTVQVANTHACGLTTIGTSYCWGFDLQGRLGNGPSITADQPRPQNPVVKGVGAVAVNRWRLAGAVADPTNVKLSFSVVPVQVSPLSATEAVAAGITVTAQSSNEAVVPTANITLSGSGTQRLATINPIAVGVSTLTFSASDPAGNQQTFSIEYGASGAAELSGRYYMSVTDASTAIDVGDGYMLVGDDETQVIYLFKQNESGYPVKTWDLTDPNQLSSNERDIEGAARIGDLIVWTTSQGNARDGAIKEYRRMIFATRITGSGANTELSFAGRYGGGPISKNAQAVVGLRNDLLAWDQNNGHGLGANYLGLVAASQPGVLPNAPSGMNVEGLEFAANGTTGYLGFRAPTINVGGTQHALIVPLTNILDLVNGVPAQQSGLAQFAAPILLNLAGRSIRELRRNDAGQYLIVAGPPDNPTVGVNDKWALYVWNGNPSQQPTLNQLLPDANYLTGGAWEAILSAPSLAPGAQVRLIADSGDTLWFGTSSMVEFGKSFSQHITLQ